MCQIISKTTQQLLQNWALLPLLVMEEMQDAEYKAHAETVRAYEQGREAPLSRMVVPWLN